MNISGKPSLLGVHVPPGVIAAPPHLYWRILVTATPGSVVSIAECQMYATDGTLLSTGGTSSASSYYAPESMFPANAFDGVMTNNWASNNVPSTGTPEWLRYQFASAVAVAVVRIVRRESNDTQVPTAFKIQYSDDGSAWTDSGSFTGLAWTNWWGKSFPAATPAAGAYCMWRAYITATQSGSPPRCAEFEMRETTGGADLTGSQYASGAQDFPGFGDDVRYAFDNFNLTSWKGTTGPPNWFANALHRAIAVAEISYQADIDANYVHGATAVQMQGSNDGGATWTDAGAPLSFAAWTADGQIQVKTVA